MMMTVLTIAESDGDLKLRALIGLHPKRDETVQPLIARLVAVYHTCIAKGIGKIVLSVEELESTRRRSHM